MILRTFGDSWLWTWYPIGTFKSHLIKQAHMYEGGISVMKALFNDLGFTVNVHNNPGSSIRHTQQLVCQQLEYRDSRISQPEVWLIMISSAFRNKTQEEWDFSSIDNFIDRYDEITLEYLQEINDSINKLVELKSNFNCMFMGGQVGLPKYLFDRIENRSPNLHLMSHNIIDTLHENYNDGVDYIPNILEASLQRTLNHQYYHESERKDTNHNLLYNMKRFLYYDEELFGKLCDEHRQQGKPVDKDLVDFMYYISRSQTDNKIEHSDSYKFPDPKHLGPVGHVYFCDYFLKFCEDKNLL